jgi:hypothetical protein
MSSDWREARDVSIAIAVGLLVYGLTRMMSNSRDRVEVEKSSADYTDDAD